MSIELTQPSHPLSSPSPTHFILSQHQGLLQWVSSSHQVAKYWSFSFTVSPSYQYSVLISFRMDWLDLISVQGTHKSLLHHHRSKASILWCSAFFIVHLSHPYMTTGKIMALTIYTFVSKVMSLLFHTLSKFVIAFLPRSSCLLISCCSHRPRWFRAQGDEICHCFHLFAFYLPWSDGAGFHDLSLFNIES